MATPKTAVEQNEARKEGKPLILGQGPWQLIERPWSTHIDPTDGLEARQRLGWRKAVEPTIRAILEDRTNPGAVCRDDLKKIDGLVRSVVLRKTDDVGNPQKISSEMLWAWVGLQSQEAYKRSLCSAEDRLELLQWLGGSCARINWRAVGAGAAPMTAVAVGGLLAYWAAIGWQEREVPDWCRKEVNATLTAMYPSPDPKVYRRSKIYRPWSEVREDMIDLLRAWQSVREGLKRHRPRRNDQLKNYLGAAVGAMNHLDLLRALEVTYPGSFPEEAITLIKSMAGVINTPTQATSMGAVMRSLEDRLILVKGMGEISIPETTETFPTMRRRL